MTVWIILASIFLAIKLMYFIFDFISYRRKKFLDLAATNSWKATKLKNEFDLELINCLSMDQHKRIYKMRLYDPFRKSTKENVEMAEDLIKIQQEMVEAMKEFNRTNAD